MGIVYGRLTALPLLADSYLTSGDTKLALTTANEAKKLQQEKHTNLQRPRTLEVLGRIHMHPDRFDPERSKEYFHDAMRSAAQQGTRVVIAHCHAGLGRLNESLKKKPAAREELTRASDMYRDMDMQFYLGQVQEELAKLG